MTYLIDSILQTDNPPINDNDLRIIYNSMYKSLSKVFKKDEKFLRHYLENGEYYDIKPESRFPPIDSYFDENESWPYEFGNANWRRDTLGNALIVQGDKKRWEGGIFWGLVDLKTFDKFKGKTIMGNDLKNTGRDHMYADVSIPLSEWIFMYDKSDNLHDEHLEKTINYLVNYCGIIEYETVQKIQGVRELILGKLLQLSRLSCCNWKLGEAYIW